MKHVIGSGDCLKQVIGSGDCLKQVIRSGDCLKQIGLDFDINNGKSKGKYVVTEYQLDIFSTTEG